MSDELVKRLRFWADFGYGAQVSKDLKEAADLLEARRIMSGQEAAGYVIPERLESTDPVISLYRKPEGAARKPLYAAAIPATEPKFKECEFCPNPNICTESANCARTL